MGKSSHQNKSPTKSTKTARHDGIEETAGSQPSLHAQKEKPDSTGGGGGRLNENETPTSGGNQQSIGDSDETSNEAIDLESTGNDVQGKDQSQTRSFVEHQTMAAANAIHDGWSRQAADFHSTTTHFLQPISGSDMTTFG